MFAEALESTAGWQVAVLSCQSKVLPQRRGDQATSQTTIDSSTSNDRNVDVL